MNQCLIRITHSKTAIRKNEASILTSPVHSRSNCGIISHEEIKIVRILDLLFLDRPSAATLGFVVSKPLSRAQSAFAENLFTALT